MNSNTHYSIIKPQLDWKGQLTKAIHSGFPSALWRMPGQKKINGLVDLRPEITTHLDGLENAPAGFMVNPFLAHHPTQPYFIKADILIEFENNHLTVKPNPSLNDSLLTAYEKAGGKAQIKLQKPDSPADVPFVKWVNEAIGLFGDNSFHKVVLARYEDVPLKDNFDPLQAFLNACERYPNAFVYLLKTDPFGSWLGATPETLLSLDEHAVFQTHALAGTQPLMPAQSLTDVAWTQKEIEEQAMVSRYVVDCFKKIRLREFEEEGPKTIKAGNMAHLLTTFKVDTKAVNMSQLATIMLDLLHPTSAVCGMPLLPALDFIRTHEPFDRELYSGFLGPVNIEEKTQLFVNLRCAKLFKGVARLFAGAGITHNSNPEKEYEETQLKMKTIKSLLEDA